MKFLHIHGLKVGYLKFPHPVCSSSNTVKRPEAPLPLISDGVLRSSAPCVEALNFF